MDWCWSWNSNTLATWCKELTHLKRPWFWEGLRGGGNGDDRGWDGWIASPTRWTWVWVDSGSWWWAGRPGVLRFMGSQRVRHDWATELKRWRKKDRRGQLGLFGGWDEGYKKSLCGIYLKCELRQADYILGHISSFLCCTFSMQDATWLISVQFWMMLLCYIHFP